MVIAKLVMLLADFYNTSYFGKSCSILIIYECTKFGGTSLVWIFFLWIFRESQTFSLGYFMGPNFFLVGISWVKNIFLCVYCGFQIFSCGYFHWVQDFFLWLFRGSQILSRGYFVGTKYFLVAICGSQFFSCGYFVYSICSIKTMVKNKDIYLKLSVKMPQ